MSASSSNASAAELVSIKLKLAEFVKAADDAAANAIMMKSAMATMETELSSAEKEIAALQSTIKHLKDDKDRDESSGDDDDNDDLPHTPGLHQPRVQTTNVDADDGAKLAATDRSICNLLYVLLSE